MNAFLVLLQALTFSPFAFASIRGTHGVPTAKYLRQKDVIRSLGAMIMIGVGGGAGGKASLVVPAPILDFQAERPVSFPVVDVAMTPPPSISSEIENSSELPTEYPSTTPTATPSESRAAAPISLATPAHSVSLSTSPSYYSTYLDDTVDAPVLENDSNPESTSPSESLMFRFATPSSSLSISPTESPTTIPTADSLDLENYSTSTASSVAPTPTPFLWASISEFPTTYMVPDSRVVMDDDDSFSIAPTVFPSHFQTATPSISASSSSTPFPTNDLTASPVVNDYASSNSDVGKSCDVSTFYQNIGDAAGFIIPCTQDSDCAQWVQDGPGCCLHPFCICGAKGVTVGSASVSCLTF